MERLTRKDGNGNWYVGDESCYDSWAVPKKFYGDAIDRLAHYEDLEEQGRLVVLTCKPSDVTVYQLRNEKHAKGVGISPRHISCATVWSDGTYALEHQGADACTSSEFGKTWFLTEAEAEAALAEKGGQIK